MPAEIVWCAVIAMALITAGVGYRVGKTWGKAVFALGVVVAVGLLAISAT